MKTKITFLLPMMVLAGLASAQDKKPKTKKQDLPKDSVYGYQLVPKSGSRNLSGLTMPVDTSRGGNVKMPNSYRKGLVEPVPMPTHRVEMLILKKKPQPSDSCFVEPVPIPNHKVEPVKPKPKKKE